jgi:hypothetical protein
MCHHIEDPTFDATAAATNPRARMRPVHRPPRLPADRMPHCNWTVTIEPDAEPLGEPEGAQWLATSRAATVELRAPGSETEIGGDTGYAGPLDPSLDLERFSKNTLLLLLDEICLQGHLLARAYMRAVERRADTETALRLGKHQLVGVAGLVARRLARFFDIEPGTDGLLRVLEVHPAFRPRGYIDAAARRAGDEIRIEVRDCAALHEGDDLTWGAVISRNGADVLASIANAIDGSRDATVPEEVAVASFSTGSDYSFRRPNEAR